MKEASLTEVSYSLDVDEWRSILAFGSPETLQWRISKVTNTGTWRLLLEPKRQLILGFESFTRVTSPGNPRYYCARV